MKLAGLYLGLTRWAYETQIGLAKLTGTGISQWQTS